MRVAAVFLDRGSRTGRPRLGACDDSRAPRRHGFVSLIGAVLIPISFAFDPVSLLPMLVFAFALATLATVIPALSAAHLWVAEPLRYE